MMVVSYMSSGALSVALSERPTVPNTVSTSGNERMIRSCSCNSCVASLMAIPGNAVGIYKEDPSYRAGMNWLPNFHANGKVSARNSRLSSSVVVLWRRQNLKTGRYAAFVAEAAGFFDSGCSLPLINMTINTGTRVIASNEENATANVFVQPSGLNMRPSCASSRKTERNDPTMITRQKNKVAQNY